MATLNSPQEIVAETQRSQGARSSPAVTSERLTNIDGHRVTAVWPRDAESRVAQAVEQIAAGRLVLLYDDVNPCGHGNLVMAAEFATSETVNFMARHGRGLVRVPLTPERCDDLDLRPMTPLNESHAGTAFTVSVEARSGVTTGISTADRARTIQLLADPEAPAGSLVCPGHVFPVRADAHGIFGRATDAEAAVELVRAVGGAPAAVCCEVLRGDGEVAGLTDLLPYAMRHGLALVTIGDVASQRVRAEGEAVPRVLAESYFRSVHGEFRTTAYQSMGQATCTAVLKGSVAGREDVSTFVWLERPGDSMLRSLQPLETGLSALGRQTAGVLLCLSRQVSTSQPGDEPVGAAMSSRSRHAMHTQPSTFGVQVTVAQVLNALDVKSARILPLDSDDDASFDPEHAQRRWDCQVRPLASIEAARTAVTQTTRDP